MTDNQDSNIAEIHRLLMEYDHASLVTFYQVHIPELANSLGQARTLQRVEIVNAILAYARRKGEETQEQLLEFLRAQPPPPPPQPPPLPGWLWAFIAFVLVVSVAVGIWLIKSCVSPLPTPTAEARATTTPLPSPTATQEMPTIPAGMDPLFCEDFSSGTLDLEKWNKGLPKYAELDGEVLRFDTPVNDTGGAVEYHLGASVPGGTIIRIRYIVQVDTPPEAKEGWLAVKTSCGPGAGKFSLLAGGKEGEFKALYRPEQGAKDQLVFSTPMSGEAQAHTVDLQWTGESLEVYIDSQLQARKASCEGPAHYAQFGVALTAGAQVSGFYDDICIWP